MTQNKTTSLSEKECNPNGKIINGVILRGDSFYFKEDVKEAVKKIINITKCWNDTSLFCPICTLNKHLFDEEEGICYDCSIKRTLGKELCSDDSQQPRMKQTRGGELKSDEGLHFTDNGSPVDIVSKGFLGGYAEFWDNPEDDRWDKEYNPDLLPETLKNKEEKQDESS